MKKLLTLCLAFIAAMTGCATSSKDISASYVSPLQYQNYDCAQISAEMARINGRVNQVGGRLDQAASNDAGITTVGAVLFWPVLFFLGGTKQQESEYARLKGEYDAIQQIAVEKKCTGTPSHTQLPMNPPTMQPAISNALSTKQ